MAMTYEGITIYRPVSDSDLLGIDTTMPGCEAIDIEASVDRYDSLWDEMLEQDFPGVAIVVTERVGLRVIDEQADGNPEDSTRAKEVLWAATEITEQLFNDGTLWAVENHSPLVIESDDEAHAMTEHVLHCGSVSAGDPWDVGGAWNGDSELTVVARQVLLDYRRDGSLPDESTRRRLAVCCA